MVAFAFGGRLGRGGGKVVCWVLLGVRSELSQETKRLFKTSSEAREV